MTLFRTIHATSQVCTYASGTNVNHCGVKRDPSLKISSVSGVTVSDWGTGLFTSIIGGGWFIGDRLGAGPGNHQVSFNFNRTTGLFFNRPAAVDSTTWGIYWRSKTCVGGMLLRSCTGCRYVTVVREEVLFPVQSSQVLLDVRNVKWHRKGWNVPCSCWQRDRCRVRL